jgi:hypothetical protein
MNIFKKLDEELKNLGIKEDLFKDFEVKSILSEIDKLSYDLLFSNPHIGAGALEHRGIFFPPKHKELADIITIKSVSGAREAVRKINALLRKGKYTLKQLRAALILAGVRAKVIAKTRAVSSAVKRRLLQVAKIYLNAAKRLGEK